MTKHEFDHRMAIFTKAREYEVEHNLNGDIIIYSKSKPNVYAALDERYNADYYINYAEPVKTALVDMDAVDDLRYFVELLIGGKD